MKLPRRMAALLSVFIAGRGIALELPSIKSYLADPADEFQIDRRCSAAFLAMERLSQTGQTANASTYRETASLFLGLAASRLAVAQGVSVEDAAKALSADLVHERDVYWQHMTQSGKDQFLTGNFSDQLLEEDLLFCRQRVDQLAEQQD